MLAPGGLYNDFAVGAEGNLWLVVRNAGGRENLLAFTTLQELRPQPVWSGALGQKVAAGKNGQVGFITIGGEIANCDPFSLGDLCSDAGKVFAHDLYIDPAGVYYALKTHPKRKTKQVYAWNPDSDPHNSWKEVKGLEAHSIAVA
jgi:hypothetical protein